MLLLQFLSLFEKEGIEHLVSGGYALCLNGAVRPTVDIDILIPDQVLNSEKYKSLEWNIINMEFEYSPQKSNSFKKVFMNTNGDTLCLHFDSNFHNYESKTVRIKSHQFDILSPKDLIQIKRKDLTPQNQEDIKALQELYG
jgi:hypothetical protein